MRKKWGFSGISGIAGASLTGGHPGFPNGSLIQRNGAYIQSRDVKFITNISQYSRRLDFSDPAHSMYVPLFWSWF